MLWLLPVCSDAVYYQCVNNSFVIHMVKIASNALNFDRVIVEIIITCSGYAYLRCGDFRVLIGQRCISKLITVPRELCGNPTNHTVTIFFHSS